MTRGLIVDLFAGGGGASEGIRMALGRDPDIAINHDEQALAMHAANHPNTHHLHGDVWHYRPRDVVGGRTVDLLWCSPTCTQFSKAKGGPLDRKLATRIRALAWVAVRWARDVQPRVIMIENVEPFAQWGPLTAEGRPCPRRKGTTFRRWVKALEAEGYHVEWRELAACDYGAPTSRKRLFVVARLDRASVAWPTPTHGRGRVPYRTAAECMDWSLPVPSIFGRTKPLADKTLARIARGIRRYVVEALHPFVVGGGAVPMLVQTGYGERAGQAPRSLDIHAPLGTVVAGGTKHALVLAFIARHYGGNENDGIACTRPLPTITTQDHHALVTATTGGERRAEVEAFMTKFCPSTGAQLSIDQKRPITITDIGMRMLAPRELFRAQGFPDAYVIDPVVDGRPLTKTAQIRMVGNSVCPHVAAAIVSANLGARHEVAA